MKFIIIDKTPTIEMEDKTNPLWRSHQISFILTFLSSLEYGCIFAEWAENQSRAIWEYTSKLPCHIKMESEGQIFVLDNLSLFRMLLARLGIITVNNSYIGAGTFSLRFREEPVNKKFYAAYLANTSELGYWIKLYSLGVNDSFEEPSINEWHDISAVSS